MVSDIAWINRLVQESGIQVSIFPMMDLIYGFDGEELDDDENLPHYQLGARLADEYL